MSVREPVSWVELGFGYLSLLLLSGAVFPLLRVTSGQAFDPTDSDSSMMLAEAAVYGSCFIQLNRHCPGWVRRFCQERTLLAIVALVFLSALWSEAPELTLRRAVALAGTAVVGIYLAERLTLRQQLLLLTLVCASAALMSAVAGLAWPDLAISDDANIGALRGVFVHKNTLGSLMALAGVAGVFFMHSQMQARWLGALLAAGALPLIALAQSQTSLVVYGLLVVAAWLFPRLQRGGPRARVLTRRLVAVAVAVLLLLVTQYQALFALLNRDVTLTGRTTLWTIAVSMIALHPVAGVGYAAFWRGWEGGSAAFWALTGWEVPNAHNGALDLMLDLGAVGVVVYGVGLAVVTRRAIRLARTGGEPLAAWPLFFLMFTLLINVTSDTLLANNSIYFALYVASAMTAFTGTRAGAPAERPPSLDIDGSAPT
jgi:exopolysaccharide production protein ExoQ